VLPGPVFSPAVSRSFTSTGTCKEGPRCGFSRGQQIRPTLPARLIRRMPQKAQQALWEHPTAEGPAAQQSTALPFHIARNLGGTPGRWATV